MEVEEGELVDSSNEKLSNDDSSDELALGGYTPLPRPETISGRPGPKPLVASAPIVYSDDDDEKNSESDSSNDSDSGIPTKSRKRHGWKGRKESKGEENKEFDVMAAKFQKNLTEMSNVPRGKKLNNIWSNFLQEDTLTQELTGIGVRHSRIDFNTRDVESYDYTLAATDSRYYESEEEEMNSNKEETKEESMEQAEENNGDKCVFGRKRTMWQRKAFRKRTKDDEKSRIILDLNVTQNDSEEDVAQDIANKLFEPKTDLISKVVKFLGREAAIKMFKDTKDVEEAGGLMILNGSRRRTPGGVYFQLIKRSADLPQEAINKIFEEDVKERERFKRKTASIRRRQRAQEQIDLIEEKPLPTRAELALQEALTKKKEALTAPLENHLSTIPSSDGEIEEEGDMKELPKEGKRLNNTPENSQDGFPDSSTNGKSPLVKNDTSCELEISCSEDNLF